ncbi:MAG TPA: response regulator [Candidatus Binatia bacterium]|nr:response regulator [Candidatus Binatia bacterium]
MASRVLIAEDEADIRRLLAFHLERDGYEVSQAGTGPEALRVVRDRRPDLVVLDLMLPEMDGLEVCRRLRQDTSTASLPIVILTAKGDEVDRVVGLEMGADDYIVKPFSPKEVVARIRAVLRRARPPLGVGALAAGTLTLDPQTHTTRVGGASLALTPKEFDLLRALLEARGRVLSREYLLDRVWGYARVDEIESRTVDVHVRRLRAKLGIEGARIVTVKSVGYRLDVDLDG